ncbi:MAG: biopolymer transporter ExbD [Chthoniobacteraceae bacterium]
MGGGGGGGEEGDFGFQIAPMVDVVFVLLLFFMALAGQNVKEGFFQIGLPSASTAAGDAPKVPIVIDIDPLGNVFVNSQPQSGSPKDRELKQLETFLSEAMKGDPEDPVIVRPALDARHERIVDVLNVCRLARVQKLSFG